MIRWPRDLQLSHDAQRLAPWLHFTGVLAEALARGDEWLPNDVDATWVSCADRKAAIADAARMLTTLKPALAARQVVTGLHRPDGVVGAINPASTPTKDGVEMPSGPNGEAHRADSITHCLWCAVTPVDPDHYPYCSLEHGYFAEHEGA
jgi:hypothetical protein